MRIKSFSNVGDWHYSGTVAYPDEVCFAYNSNFVIISNTDAVSPASVIVEFGGKRLEAALYNGYAKVYISGIMTLLFPDIAIERARRASLRVKTPEGDVLLDVALTVVCGGLRMDERLNEHGAYVYDKDNECFTRTLQWFRNYPMLVSMLRATQDSTMLSRYDGNRYDSTLFTFRYSIADVDYSDTLPAGIGTSTMAKSPGSILATRPGLSDAFADKVDLGTIVAPTDKEMDFDSELYPDWPSTPPTTGGDTEEGGGDDGGGSSGGEGSGPSDGDSSGGGGSGGEEGGSGGGTTGDAPVYGVVYFVNFGIFLKKEESGYGDTWEASGVYGATVDYMDSATGKARTDTEWNYNGKIVKRDKATGQLYYTGFGFAGRNGIIDLNPALSFPDAGILAAYRLSGNKKASGPFDRTFDYTFQRLADTDVLTRLVVRPEKDGRYLRWIDRHGLLMYYLFTAGTTSTKTEPSDDTVDATGEYGGMYFEAVRTREIESSVSITCGAAHLNAETFNQVSSILDACHVDLFLGYTRGGREIWQPVNVEGGTVTHHDNRELNDIEITVSFRQQTQRI